MSLSPRDAGIFEDPAAGKNLRARSLRGGAAVLSSQFIKFLIALGGLAILARQLSPTDFGLLGMVAAITGLLALFKDLGLAMATIQRENITHEQISTLFWINIGISVLLMIVLAAISPLIAILYDEPRLVRITMVLAVAYLFGGLSVQHLALLRRQMRFGAVAVIEIAAQLSSVLVAVVLAWRLQSYWALVAMHVTLPAVTAVGVWLACSWRPGMPVRGCGVRSMLSYGGYQTGFSIVNYVIRNLDNVLIGWRWGPVALGVYREAYRLMLLPIQQISSPTTHVAMATLSRLQSDPDRFRAFYCRGIELMVSLGMPIVVMLVVCADLIIRTVLGEKWMEAVPIFRMLGPAAFLGSFNVASGWVHSALGRNDRKFRWGLFAAIVFSIGFMVGIQWGAIGIAVTVSIVTCALRVPGLLYAFHNTPVTLGDLWRAIWRAATASLAAGAVLAYLREYVPIQMHHLPVLLINAAMYGVLFVGVWRILPGGRASIAGVIRLLKDLRDRTPPDVPAGQDPA